MTDGLSARDYRRIADLLERQVGIRLPPSKQTMVEGRLRRRMRSIGLDDLGEYCGRLFNGDMPGELPGLIDAMTTNKTDFYREPEHFAFLQRSALPQLLAERRNPRLKVWSAACSNGAEPYTLAMILADLAPRQNFTFAILGTDISTQVLETAVVGIYPQEMMAPVPPDVQQRYVMRARERHSREVRIAPELRRQVCFMRLNLVDESYPVDRDVDIIFCRNVLIYFAHETQRKVIGRLSRHLRHGGFMFLGHSDCATGDQYAGLKPVAVTVFQRQ